MEKGQVLLGYIGTYTKGMSKGIYSFTLDTQTGKISVPTLVAKLMDPTYLAISQNKKHLYVIYKANGNGAVASYSINEITGELTLLSTTPSKNGSYCHISVDSNEQIIAAANYGDGIIDTYQIHENAVLCPIRSTIQHKGFGPNKKRQESAHAHYAGFTPDEKYIVVVDLGLDQIITYRAEQYTLHKLHTLAVSPGSGPRHLVFHPTKPLAYVMAELHPEVIVLQYQTENGRFKTMQTIRSIPFDFNANNQGSAIHISSDGQFVYAANRGHDSIAVFGVNKDSGLLHLIEFVYTEGHWPRDFSLDPTESYLITSNEESGNLTVFSRNAQSGKLTPIQAEVKVPYPVCIKFL